jgi:HEAT repeat protein
VAARKEVLSRLLELLRDSERDVRIVTAEALGRIRVRARSGEVRGALLNMLGNAEWFGSDDSEERRAVAVALGQMAEWEPHEEILAVLRRLLGDVSGAAGAAAEALGRIARTEASDSILARVLELRRGFWDGDQWCGFQFWVTVQVMARMGAAAARDEVRDRLLEMLSDADDHHDPYHAAIAVGQIGAAMASEEIVARLVEMARPEQWYRSVALEALERIANEGVHVFNRANGTLTIKRLASSPQPV